MSAPELTAAALVGVARASPPTAAALPPVLADLRAALADRPPEEALLLLAGADALYVAAGYLPERAGVEWRLPAYRPEGDRPPCSPAAARFLERALNQQDTTLLPELLRLLDRAGRRAPDELLPHVLNHGAKIARLRPALLPILGERGRWLGAINPTWRYAAVDLGDERATVAAWESDPAGRPSLARSVRPRDPAAGRRLIVSTWRGEPDATRRDLLVVLETGLSIDDEPFLERALDDRDAQVRRKAADLLATLPGSRLAGRITAAAGSILILKDGGLAPHFPGAITDAMVRDGIVRPGNQARPADPRRDAPRSATEWSRLLIQTVGAIPLEHWAARFGMPPEEIVGAAGAGKWPRTLLTAFATAALRQRDGRWIAALLAAEGYTERTGMLLATLAPETGYARLAERLAAGDDAAIVVFLRRWPGEWDEASGCLLLNFLARQAASDTDTKLGPTLRFLSRQFAQRCPPSLADHAATLAARGANRAWEASLRHIAATLALRREMRHAVMSDYPS